MTIFASAVLGPDGRPFDQIRLTGVTATGHHGVLPHERAEGQEFGADVVLHLDTRPAATGDDLADTVSYADVAEQVHAVLAGSPADLVETVAERIAAAVLEHRAVVAVDVRVHKPQAPIAVPFDDVEVAIRRDRVKTPVVPAPAAREHAAVAEPAETAAPVDDEGAPAPFAVGAALPAPFPPVPPVPAPMPIPAPVPVPAHAEVPPAPEPVVDRLEVDPVEPVEVVLAIGANLGDPQATLREAVTDLDRLPGIQVTEVSPLARTTAVGGPEDQPDYLNAVLVARTTLSPRALLRATQAVENAHGRVREEHWGPRTLDVDIVRYGSLVARADDLELPHPRAHERAFVLVPWAEVQPDAELPGLGGGPVARLAETAPDRTGIRWMALDWLTESSVRTGSYPVADAAGAEPAPADDAAADSPHERPGTPAPGGGEAPHAAYDPEQPPYQAAPAFEPAFEPTFEPERRTEQGQAFDQEPAYDEPRPASEPAQRPADPYGHDAASPFPPAGPAEPGLGSPYPGVTPPYQESGAVPVTPFPRVLPADPVDAPEPAPLPVRPTTPATPFPPVPPASPAAPFPPVPSSSAPGAFPQASAPAAFPQPPAPAAFPQASAPGAFPQPSAATPFPPVVPASPAPDSGRVHTPVSPFAPVRPATSHPVTSHPATPSGASEQPGASFPIVVPGAVPPAPVPSAQPPSAQPPTAQPPLWQPMAAGTPEAPQPDPDAANDRWIPFDHPDKER